MVFERTQVDTVQNCMPTYHFMQYYLMFYCSETLTKENQLQEGKCEPVTQRAETTNSFGPKISLLYY